MTKPSSARMTYRPDSRGKLIREASQFKPQPLRQPQSQQQSQHQPKPQDQPKPSVLKGADPSHWKTEVPESLSSLAFTTEYKNWNSPFQQNIEAVESVTSAQSVLGDPLDQLFTGPIIDMEFKGPRKDMEFTGPIIDMEDTLCERKLNIPPVRRIKSGVKKGVQRRGPSWTMVLLSVAGAVATGALFGYIALTLFAGESVLPAGSLKSSQPPTSSVNASGGKTGAGGNNGSLGSQAPLRGVKTVTGRLRYGNARTGTGTGSATGPGVLAQAP